MVAVHQEVAEVLRAAAHEAVSEAHLVVADEEAPSVGEAVAEVLLEVAVAVTRCSHRMFQHYRGVLWYWDTRVHGNDKMRTGAVYVTISRARTSSKISNPS